MKSSTLFEHNFLFSNKQSTMRPSTVQFLMNLARNLKVSEIVLATLQQNYSLVKSSLVSADVSSNNVKTKSNSDLKVALVSVLKLRAVVNLLNLTFRFLSDLLRSLLVHLVRSAHHKKQWTQRTASNLKLHVLVLNASKKFAVRAVTLSAA